VAEAVVNRGDISLASPVKVMGEEFFFFFAE
jgi:hypothetical protein